MELGEMSSLFIKLDQLYERMAKIDEMYERLKGVTVPRWLVKNCMMTGETRELEAYLQGELEEFIMEEKEKDMNMAKISYGHGSDDTTVSSAIPKDNGFTIQAGDHTVTLPPNNIIYDGHVIKINDPVQNPEHYAKGSLECIDWIRAMLTTEEYRGYLKGAALKYIWRYEDKGKPVQDLEKARKYLEFLIEDLKRDDEAEEKPKTHTEVTPL